jgi:CRP/FNR family transcriptional regulator
MAMLAARLPGLQKELFRLMSRDIGHAERMAAERPADSRLASFLLDVSARMAGPALPLDRIRLPMPRSDVASYLRLAPETVSRLLRRMQDEALVRVRGREVGILDRPELRRLAEATGKD